MALFTALSLRRHRSRPELGSQRPPSSSSAPSLPPPKPAFPSSPPPPPARSDSAHSIPVPPPPSPNRLRREATSIGYEALDESTEPESSVEVSAEGGEGVGGRRTLAKAAEESANVEMERVGMFRRATKRWSLPALAPTAVFPQPDVPLPLASEQVERLSSPPLSPRSGDKGKRRISGSSLSSTGGLTSPSSPSLSPASSFRSPPTSVSSHSPSSASASTSSLSLNLVISTTINQSNGRRVLASRRSRQMSGDGSLGGGGQGGEGAPTRCKRTKGSYGVGDDEESLWQREEDVFGGIEKASLGGLAGAFNAPPTLAMGGIGLGLVDGGLRMEPDGAIDEEGETSRETLHPDYGDFATPTSTPPASLRRPRPPLAPLQPVPHSASPAHPVPTSPTYYRRPPIPLPVPLPPPVLVPQHKPIQPLYPPPPLYPPSPSKTGALSSLTRAYSAYSSSSSDSPMRLKRRNSLQPLRGKSLSKRLSLGGLSGSAARGSASYGPPMTPSSASFSSSTSAHSRRFSAPVSPLTPLSRAPSTSASGCTTNGGDPLTPSSPSFSILTLSVPPTPSVESGESTVPLVGGGWGGGGGGGMVGSSSFSSLGHGGASSSSEAGHSTGAVPPVRRASVVSFELPPSPTLSRRRTQLYPPPPPSPPVQANGFAGGDGGGEGIRRKAHRRAASDGDAMLRQGYSGGGRNGSGWIWGGTEVVRERLFIANPDLPPIPSASLSTALAFEDGPPVPPVPPLPSPFSHHHHHQHHIDRQQQQERNASPLIGIAC